MTLTLKEHIARAGAFADLIKKHQADLADLADDVPKAISIAQDFHDLFAAKDVKAPVVSAPAAASPASSAPPASKSAALPPAPRVTAAQAAQHVKEHGLSDSERAAFDRASRNTA